MKSLRMKQQIKAMIKSLNGRIGREDSIRSQTTTIKISTINNGKAIITITPDSNSECIIIIILSIQHTRITRNRKTYDSRRTKMMVELWLDRKEVITIENSTREKQGTKILGIIIQEIEIIASIIQRREVFQKGIMIEIITEIMILNILTIHN